MIFQTNIQLNFILMTNWKKSLLTNIFHSLRKENNQCFCQIPIKCGHKYFKKALLKFMAHTWNFLKLNLKLLSKILLVSIQDHLLLKKEWTISRMKMDNLLERNKLWMLFRISIRKDIWFYLKEGKVQLYVRKIHLLLLKVIAIRFSTFMKRDQRD